MVAASPAAPPTAAARRRAPAEGAPQTFWRGRIKLWQPPRGGGYRFNLDSVLLAGFCPPARRVLDLGAGCGIVGLLLLVSGGARRVVAVERSAALAELARRNAAANRLAGRLHVVEADLRGRDVGRFDLVAFNPPYFAAAKGSPCGEAGRDVARHERFGVLADFVRRAAHSLTTAGRVAAVVRPQRAQELAALMAAQHLWPLCRAEVLPRAGAPAAQVLLLFGRRARLRAGAGRRARPRPWVLHPPVGPERYCARLRPWIEAGVAPPR